MKINRNIYYTKHGQLHSKRRVLGILIVLLVLSYFWGRDTEEIVNLLALQFVPALVYEADYDSDDIEYEASYEVPEWFYEDEYEKPHNADTAASELTDAPGEDPGNEDAAMDSSVTAFSNKSIGTLYDRKQLSDPDFLKSRIFSVDGNTSMSDEETRLENLLDVDLSLSDIGSEPKILIYHTHASESFSDSRPGVSEDTVVGIGAYLADLLNNQYGIPTYHDETAYDIIDGHLDRSKAYEKAYDGISEILKENPSIEVVIDLHRDGVDEDTHLVTEVNGKPTAKIMFLNGVSRSNMNGEIDYLKNPNKLTNLAFSFQLYLTGKEDYGDYVRKIYVRSLRYNLHVMPRATLIEAGAQNNTIEEEKNAMEPLAAMLDKVLRNSK